MDSEDALASYNFQVEIDGVTLAYFKEISGLTTEIKVIEHEEVMPGGKAVIKKIPGGWKNGDLSLKRGLTQNADWWKWINSVHSGDITEARRNGSIVVYNYALGEQARINVQNMWPSKVTISGLKAGGTEVIIEEVTLVHEGLEFA